MLPWRGVLCHLIIVLFQPLYFACRHGIPFTASYNTKLSLLWPTLTALTWAWIVKNVTIYFFTNPLNHLPSPPESRFPLSHLSIFIQQPPTDRLPKVCRTVPNDGLIVIWGLLYLRATIIPTDPRYIMEILNNHSYDWEKPGVARRLLARTLGEGLINVEGNVHKAMRKAVAPAFTGRGIRDLAPLFYRKGIDFGETMAHKAKATSDGQLEIMSQMSRVTLDLIGAAGIGRDFNTIENDEDKLAGYYSTITDATNRGAIYLYLAVMAILPSVILRRLPGKVYSGIAQAQFDLRQSVRQLVAEKKQAMELKTIEQTDIIATIMKSGDFSDEYLCAQLLTFLAAGHDTTSSALTFTTWLLAKHPEMQDKLRKECQEHLSDKKPDDVDAQVFDNMPYLTAVCNETLRLYPTVPLTGRHAVVDTIVGPYKVPKGTEVLLLPWAINRLPALWGDDADTYRPERWLEGPLANNGGAKSPLSFITFLHGPRSCIGQSFAKLEMKCILAALILRFRFEVADPTAEIELAGVVTVKPKHGLHLRLHDLKA